MKEYQFAPNEYIHNLYDNTFVSPFDSVSDKTECTEIIEKVRLKLTEMLHIDRIPQKCDELKPVLLKSEMRKDYKIDTYSVEICSLWKMLYYILTPSVPSGVGVVALCGHGYGCRQIIRMSKRGHYRTINFLENGQRGFAIELAKRGNTVIVPEMIGFGKARLIEDMHKPFYISSCDTISHHLLEYGLNMAGLRVYQAMRCVDLLNMIGCSSIGCMGISGGGLVTLYAACVDERIQKAVVSCYVNTFRSSILSCWHCPDNYVPDMLRNAEIYDIASAIAPRSLLIESGTKDHIFPIEASKFAHEKIAKVYNTMNASDNLVVDVFEGRHRVNGALSFDFFNK